MPLYYFHLRDKTQFSDPDGTDLADSVAARNHAVQVARELMFKSPAPIGGNWSEWTMSVEDREGREIFAFVMSDLSDRDAAAAASPKATSEADVPTMRFHSGVG